MPVHLSPNGLRVLDENGQLVPGGEHKTHAEALAHAQAMNINMRRQEGRPVAPKQKSETHLTVEEREKIPDQDFVDPERRRFFIRNRQDVIDAVHSYGRADPKIPFEHFKQRLTAIAKRKGFEEALPEEWKQEKASWLADPTDEDIYEFLINDDMDRYLGISKAEIPELQDNLFTDRNWHTTPLPDVWVRAHPFGDANHKDEHGEYFDKATNFYNKDIKSVPVTIYHNWNDDGTPIGNPTTVGKSNARAFKVDGQWKNVESFDDNQPVKLPNVEGDGRWDRLHFNENMPRDKYLYVAKALQEKRLRSSPSVVPDLHHVDDRTGHIDHWGTGSIAVLAADGDHQPANRLAIGIPAMKALYKAAQIQFPKSLEGKTKMGKTMKASRFAKARELLKALMKALSEDEGEEEQEGFHSHQDGTSHADHDGSEQEHTHDEKGAMKGVIDPNPLSSITEFARFDGADEAKRMKAEKEELAREMEEPRKEDYDNELGEGDVQLDWSNRDKATMKAVNTMKAQVRQLQMQNDLKDFDAWALEQMQLGKLLPAERDDIRTGYLLALRTDRAQHPTMKAKGLSMLKLYKQSIEQRPSLFGEQPFDANLMKGFNLAGFAHPQKRDPDAPISEEEWANSPRRKELLKQTDMGQLALKKQGGQNA